MKAAIIAGCVVLSVLNASAAHAGPQADKPYKAEITVTRGCDGGKDMNCHYIWVKGDIGFNDAARFEQVIKNNKITKAAVILNSGGGVLNASLAIGQSVKEKGFMTVVQKDAFCVSGCALIWLAGSTHYLENNAHIGFHGVFKIEVDKNGGILKNAKPMSSNEGNAKVGAYLGWLGFSYDAIGLMTAADPNHALWLNNEDTAKKLGIKVTKWVDAREHNAESAGACNPYEEAMCPFDDDYSRAQVERNLRETNE